MSDAPAWPSRFLGVLVPLTALLLVVQYLLGLWTNVYAPSVPFTHSTSMPSLGVHYLVGYALGALTLVGVLIAALSRNLRSVVLEGVVFVAVLWAAFAGMAYVGTQPNPPVASFSMGFAFLIAFAANLVLSFFLMMQRGVFSRMMPAPPTTTHGS
jgi:hypothetical protein